MRSVIGAVTLLLLGLTSLVSAWSSEDHEIFRLRDDLITHEGQNVTFYSFVGLTPNAKQDDINRAYRKLSRTMHPDKARSIWLANYNKPKQPTSTKGVKPTVHVQKDKKPSQSQIKKFNKEAEARFKRLSVIVNVLRGPDRERYDHFLYNGFPAWKGTGYYYERFRPGLGMVLVGLFIFIGGGVHYAALYLQWKQRKEFVERYIKHARRAAWGDEGAVGAIPGLGGATNGSARPPTAPEQSEDSMNWNRRMKRMQGKQDRKEGRVPVKKSTRAVQKARTAGISEPQDAEITSGPVGAKKRTVAENGKVLIVDSAGNVWLEDETEEGDVQEFLLDPDEVPPPTVADTWLVRLPIYGYNQSLGRVLNKQTPEQIAYETTLGDEAEQDEADIALNSALAPNANAEARKRKTKAKP